MTKRPLISMCFLIRSFLFILLVTGCEKDEDSVTVTDIEGNVYLTVNIGTQVWMKENLRTTKYNDGNPIPVITNNTSWANLSDPGYCWYSNKEALYRKTYGALYNWFAVGSGNICPEGWRVPTFEDWTILVGELGGESVAGGSLKERGTSNWNFPNTGASNSSKFSALPGGWRNGEGGLFAGERSYGCFWSSTEDFVIPEYSLYLELDFGTSIATMNIQDKRNGKSVRCLKE